MKRHEILMRVKEVIADRGFDTSAVTADSTLDDIGLESLDKVELVMALEEMTGLEISDEVAERFVTVGDIVTYLEDSGAQRLFL